MSKLGIIPAAGNANRFGGIFKELLPVSDTESLLTRTLTFLEEIPTDHNIIITNPWKYAAHAHTVGDRAELVEQKDYSRDAWGAIQASFPHAMDMNYYLMPDTYTPARSYYEELPEADFVMGLFSTVHPERYGVLWDGAIYDKSDTFNGSIQMAWGFVAWSKAVVRFWQESPVEIQTHTQGFNMAMKRFGYTTFHMPFYFDIASMQDYKGLLTHV